MASPNNGKKKVAKKTAKKSPKEITFNYIKIPSYRTYHVDGIFGGLTPRGKIYCELFIDRNPTPQTAVHELSEDGYLSGTPKEQTGKGGVIREIECGIIFDIDTAKTFKEWLDSRIKQYNKNLKLSKKGKK
jgi:hypothetical protein